ncbi:uncharacterized protein HD556DRAFT_1444346 [Suillus plorans]|uniref:Uncharacterized protein n=1 Tax=Suillus plorans TaxID=116603 RepID=A0A9P7AN60_9AGAM|nr:uncharacterized protein HD556DRAFT_1444346 [Suillus plorans]KAG1792673.1 hypothetical protein HD556DRAFT_1444346 [Suillus plorans]
MDIMDIVRCFMVNSFFSTLGREVINGRLNYILTHVVGSESRRLRDTLDATRSVILGSSALDILLYGTSPILQHELRIATPNYAKEVLAQFFRKLGFIVDQSPTFYSPPSVACMYDHDYIQRRGKKVVLINSPTDSVMPVVLAHRSSTDCMFLASGGLFFGYPELMDSQTTLLPLVHPRSFLVRQFTQREYKVQTRNCWTLPCENKCPTLWRRMDNGLLVTWHNGLVPSNITDGQDLQWTLTSHCANTLCWNNIFKRPDSSSVVCDKESIDLRIAISISQNAGLPCITGLLFGVDMIEPYAVPLYIDKGRKGIFSINDLDVRPFIRERGMEPPNIIDCSVTRQVVVMSDCAFIIIRDHDHVLDTVPSLCGGGPFYRGPWKYFPLTPLRGNMLVVMHDLDKEHLPRDILKAEIEKVTQGIIEYVALLSSMGYSSRR